MCSSPKGHKTTRKKHLKTSSSRMAYDDYAAMIRRSNQSYETRQLELQIMRSQKTNNCTHKPVEVAQTKKTGIKFEAIWMRAKFVIFKIFASHA